MRFWLGSLYPTFDYSKVFIVLSIPPLTAVRFLALSVLEAAPRTGDRSEGLGPGLLLPVRFRISKQKSIFKMMNKRDI